jgi:hypothetical protein
MASPIGCVIEGKSSKRPRRECRCRNERRRASAGHLAVDGWPSAALLESHLAIVILRAQRSLRTNQFPRALDRARATISNARYCCAPRATRIRELTTTGDGATGDDAGDAGDDICSGATFELERA